jgi:hypothetical protein
MPAGLGTPLRGINGLIPMFLAITEIVGHNFTKKLEGVHAASSGGIGDFWFDSANNEKINYEKAVPGGGHADGSLPYGRLWCHFIRIKAVAPTIECSTQRF